MIIPKSNSSKLHNQDLNPCLSHTKTTPVPFETKSQLRGRHEQDHDEYRGDIQPSTVHMCAFVLSHFSRVRLFATLWTVACQTPLSMGFSRQEYWSGLPYLPLGDLSNSGIQVTFLMSPVLAGVFSPTSTTWEAWESKIMVIKTSFDFPSEEGKATC